MGLATVSVVEAGSRLRLDVCYRRMEVHEMKSRHPLVVDGALGEDPLDFWVLRVLHRIDRLLQAKREASSFRCQRSHRAGCSVARSAA